MKKSSMVLHDGNTEPGWQHELFKKCQFEQSDREEELCFLFCYF